MVKQNLLGVEVDQGVYDDYMLKLYDIPGLGELTLRTVELYAGSSEIQEKYPEAAAACRDVVERIREAVTGKAPEPDHVVFSAYIDDLYGLYKTAAAARGKLRNDMQAAEAKWKEAVSLHHPESNIARAKADFLDKQAAYNDDVEKLYVETQASIGEIRDQFMKDVDAFYAVSGDRIDESVKRLLDSGVQLREAEIADLFEKNTNNPTMLRLLGEYCKNHNITFPKAVQLFSLALSDGRNELDVFNRVADPLLLAVGHSESSVTVWAPESGLFNKYVTEAKNELNNFYVRP